MGPDTQNSLEHLYPICGTYRVIGKDSGSRLAARSLGNVEAVIDMKQLGVTSLGFENSQAADV